MKDKISNINHERFYKKYKHVIRGSIHNATPAEEKELGTDGLVCVIKCIDTGKPRTIKIQDAFQVRRTKEAQKAYRSQLRKKKRKEKIREKLKQRIRQRQAA